MNHGIFLRIILSDHLPRKVVLYVCETWSFTLRKEQRMKVLEGKILRRIISLKQRI